MWQWLKSIFSCRKTIKIGAYWEGFTWGQRRRGYIHDHPEQALPYKHGTQDAQEWMEGYQAGMGEDGKGESE